MKKKNRLIAFLGPETEFDGELNFDGTLRLDGRFKGKITGSGNLIVGEKAVIDADVQVSAIAVSGKVSGSIRAHESIEILVPGNIFGNIQAPNIIIHKGAILRGNCITRELEAPDRKRATDADSSKTDAPKPIPLKRAGSGNN